jgi:hypothetical protein
MSRQPVKVGRPAAEHNRRAGWRKWRRSGGGSGRTHGTGCEMCVWLFNLRERRRLWRPVGPPSAGPGCAPAVVSRTRANLLRPSGLPVESAAAASTSAALATAAASCLSPFSCSRARSEGAAPHTEQLIEFESLANSGRRGDRPARCKHLLALAGRARSSLSISERFLARPTRRS